MGTCLLFPICLGSCRDADCLRLTSLTKSSPPAPHPARKVGHGKPCCPSDLKSFTEDTLCHNSSLHDSQPLASGETPALLTERETKAGCRALLARSRRQPARSHLAGLLPGFCRMRKGRERPPERLRSPLPPKLLGFTDSTKVPGNLKLILSTPPFEVLLETGRALS